MTTTSPVALVAAVRAEPARWRDVLTVAQLWARAFARRRPRQGRRLHVLARYPRSLVLAVILRRRTVLLRPEPSAGQAAACLTLHRPSPASSPLLLLTMLAAVVVGGCLDVALGAIGPMPLALTVAVLLIVGRAPIRDAVRTLRGRRQSVRHPAADIEIGNVATYPHGGGLGTHLMDRLIGILDSGHLAAQLKARSSRAAAWYADLGFLSAPKYPHSLHMYRPATRTTPQPPRPGPDRPRQSGFGADERPAVLSSTRRGGADHRRPAAGVRNSDSDSSPGSALP